MPTDSARIDAIYARLVAAAPAWEPTSLEAYTGDPFKVLIAALLSTQTREERTTQAARALFALADTPAAMLALSDDAIREAIRPVTFYNVKTEHIRRVCARIVANGGVVPATLEELLRYEGVGGKVAALVLAVGHGRHEHIAVDTHVNRIGKRLGLVDPALKQPSAVGEALQAVLPRAYWPRWNGLMVQFGRAICLPRAPRCAICPLYDLCPRIGVD